MRTKENWKSGLFGGLGLVAFAAVVATSSASRTVVSTSVQPTKILVRAVARDAKVLGSNVQGARITIRNAETGAVLAKGIQQGTTGDTELIVVKPRQRGETVYDTPKTAAFIATLELERPTRVEVIAEGPLDSSNAVQRSSKTLLLVPGHDIVGEGLILELNGFTVVIDRPANADESIAPISVTAGEEITVRAHITMLCGCPTSPGGLWDSNQITILARFVQRGQILVETSLEYAGEMSTFEGTLPATGFGAMELQVIAVEATKANAGIATRDILVESSSTGG